MTDINSILDNQTTSNATAQAPTTQTAAKSKKGSNSTAVIANKFQQILSLRLERKQLSEDLKDIKTSLKKEHELDEKVINGVIKLLEEGDFDEFDNRNLRIADLYAKIRNNGTV